VHRSIVEGRAPVRFPDKYSPPLKRLFPLTDVRDWDAIEAWAAAPAELLARET